MTLSVNKTIELQAVRLFGSENNEYGVTLVVIDIDRHSLASVRGAFTSMPMQWHGLLPRHSCYI